MIPFAWHRLVIPLPDKWSPLKLEGDSRKGYAEFADLHRVRLGVRWQQFRREPKDVEGMLRAVVKEAAGLLESKRARRVPVAGGALYLEDEAPYKRDFAAVYLPASRRLVQLIYPLRRRETVLEQEILPGVAEVPPEQPAPWGVFELTCLTPAGYRLERHRLNAGDLSLFFVTPRRGKGLVGPAGWMSVRQIAVASLALQRTRLFGWLRAMQKPDDRYYRAAKEAEETELEVAGQRYGGLKLGMVRRRRYGFLRWFPATCVTLGCHDTERDRLVVVHGTDEVEVRQLAATVGLGLPGTTGGAEKAGGGGGA